MWGAGSGKPGHRDQAPPAGGAGNRAAVTATRRHRTVGQPLPRGMYARAAGCGGHSRDNAANSRRASLREVLPEVVEVVDQSGVAVRAQYAARPHVVFAALRAGRCCRCLLHGADGKSTDRQSWRSSALARLLIHTPTGCPQVDHQAGCGDPGPAVLAQRHRESGARAR